MSVNTQNLAAMRSHATAVFKAGLAAVAPEKAIKHYCRREGQQLFVGDHTYDLDAVDRLWITGAGKASAFMAKAMEEILGERISGGLVSVKYGHGTDLEHIAVQEAGHPVPDENGVSGARAIRRLVGKAGENDLVICLISGGGSALSPLPAEGITLGDKQETTQVLLGCGATIHEINAIRKHLSDFKGGQLMRAAHPARMISLILSDVTGDDLDVIASGPTVPDSETYGDCLEIIDRYGIEDHLPAAVMTRLQSGAAGIIPETPKAGDPVFERCFNLIVGNNFKAITAARDAARALGYNVMILSSLIQGETREVAKVHAAVALEIVASDNPLPPPACVLSGGETTVTLKGSGLGGRNQEFALSAALAITGSKGIVVLSGGTDGTDGPTDAAGAVVDGFSVSRAQARGINARAHLSANDAYNFFKPLGDLLITGPTGTNVMDLRILLVS